MLGREGMALYRGSQVMQDGRSAQLTAPSGCGRENGELKTSKESRRTYEEINLKVIHIIINIS